MAPLCHWYHAHMMLQVIYYGTSSTAVTRPRRFLWGHIRKTTICFWKMLDWSLNYVYSEVLGVTLDRILTFKDTSIWRMLGQNYSKCRLWAKQVKPVFGETNLFWPEWAGGQETHDQWKIFLVSFSWTMSCGPQNPGSNPGVSPNPIFFQLFPFHPIFWRQKINWGCSPIFHA